MVIVVIVIAIVIDAVAVKVAFVRAVFLVAQHAPSFFETGKKEND